MTTQKLEPDSNFKSGFFWDNGLKMNYWTRYNLKKILKFVNNYDVNFSSLHFNFFTFYPWPDAHWKNISLELTRESNEIAYICVTNIGLTLNNSDTNKLLPEDLLKSKSGKPNFSQ